MNIVLLESLGVPQPLLESLAEPLRRAGHAFAACERTTDPARLTAEASDADALILANMPLPGGVIRACGHLRFIDVAFTGVDHIDLAAAGEKGVIVSNAAGYATEAVAELTIGQMLALLRNVPETESRCREGGTRAGLIGRELSARTVGIVGTGAIGLRVAALLRAFGCRVLGCSRHERLEAASLLTYVPLDTLLREADIVTLHCPLTAQTRGLIGREQLALMKKDALLINMARGPVVNAGALAQALNAGRLGGAAVDVFDTEPPLPAESPLLSAARCRVTPHIGFASEESLALRARIVFSNLSAWLDGRPINVVR